MKTKAVVAIMVTLLLVSMAFNVVPVKAEPGTIKVGIFGPMRLIQGVGMLEGAQIAVDWIDSNPINISNTLYTVDLIPVDSALGLAEPEPTPASGAAAMSWLLDQDPDVIMGGFSWFTGYYIPY